jgi:hypothetical protein
MQVYFTETVVDAFAGALEAAAGDSTHRPAPAMARALASDVLRGGRWPGLLGEFRALATEDPGVGLVYAELRVTQRAQLVDALRRAGEQVPLKTGLDLEVAATLLLTCVHGLSVERSASADAMPQSLVEGLFAHVLEGILA